VPESLKFEILSACHGDIYSGHFGIERTFARLQLRYFWTTMFEDASNFVASCIECCSKKRPPRPGKAVLYPLPLAYINQRWAMDLVKFPESHRGNIYALTFIEYCSRYACAFPIREAVASNIANIFLNEIIFRFGFCKELLSDRGANLAGEVMKEVCKILKINRLLTSSLHPQTDGLLEKFHSTLASNITFYVNDKHKDWDLYLPAVCYAYNTAICLDSIFSYVW
jgi:hypothetical protein